MSLHFGPLFDVRNKADVARIPPSRPRLRLALLLMFVLMLPGCGGCTEDPKNPSDPKAAEKKDAKKAEKPKPDFEPLKLRILPQQDDLALRPVKPGHWSTAVEAAKANNYDFIGDLRAELWESGASTGADLERTPHRLVIRRPAPLAKGQPKQLEFDFFVPGDRERASLQSELISRSGATAASPGPEPLTLMRPYQYKIVVLAAEPDRYRPLERLDAVRMPYQSTPLYHYQIVAVPIKTSAPLPNNPMAWTSIAYVIWDDIDPQSLTAQQQQALLDWLHWGGQIIMSGPKSLDRLRGSFLAPYLPATAGEAIEIDEKRLEPLSRRWTLPEEGRPGPPLAPIGPWSGVELDPVAGAEFLPDTSKLIVERQVGRGRIVVTAFRLTERDLWEWHSFDNFFNGCLLRRPPRKYELSPEAGLNLKWADTSQNVTDPHLVSQVRLLSRDWKEKDAFTPRKAPPEPTELQQSAAAPDPLAINNPPSDSMALLTEVGGPGVAGWSDFSDVGNASRFVLREGAGIVIPNADFVIWVLILYLIVLVPLNWLVFWGLGRVEWAWVAAPIIALGGMVAVAKVAQLDIGFARSQTEVAVLETFGGYPRGHLTRYTALYTSLSSTYDAKSAEQNTLILPFSTEPNFTPLPGQSFDTVTFQTGPETRLSNFGVSSNSTSMLHSEQALNLGGAIDYTPHGNQADIVNHTKFGLTQAAVLRRTADGTAEIGWIGDLPAGRGTQVSFLLPDAFAARIPNWSFRLGDSQNDKGASIDLSPLADLVRNVETLRPGESRLVALIDHVLPGLDLQPESSQSPRGGTLLVAHLQPAALPPPTPDFNARRDFPNIIEDLFDDEDMQHDER